MACGARCGKQAATLCCCLQPCGESLTVSRLNARRKKKLPSREARRFSAEGQNQLPPWSAGGHGGQCPSLALRPCWEDASQTGGIPDRPMRNVLPKDCSFQKYQGNHRQRQTVESTLDQGLERPKNRIQYLTLQGEDTLSGTLVGQWTRLTQGWQAEVLPSC